MKTIKKIGLTGNIGSGKSTIACMLEEYGFNVIDSDKHAHQYFEKSHPVYPKVLSNFGSNVLLANGNIDREKLSSIVFSDREKLKQLESIVYAELNRDLEKIPADKVLVLESAVLFEKNLAGDYDFNIAVYAPYETCKERAIKRGMDEADFERRWKVQIPPEEKLKRADYVINNSGSLEEASKQVRSFVKQYFPNQIKPYLYEKWKSFWEKSKFNGNMDEIFEKICNMYSKPERAYHNLFHIADCLDELENAREKVFFPRELELAVWLHDIVYETRAKDNEEKSADFAQELMMELIPEKNFDLLFFSALVRRCIFATKHNYYEEIPEARFCADIDLSIFSQSHEYFDRYCREIRQEYSQAKEEAYRAKRREILQSFLKRDSIYYTTFFRQKYKARAEENLQREIERLTS